MEKLMYQITYHLYTIRLAFSGINPINDEKSEDLIETNIHTVYLSDISEDKNNLKADRHKVLKDYSKAYKEKAKEVKSQCELANCL